MPGTNAGTGQPLSFRCSNCRNVHGTAEYHGQIGTSNYGRVDRVTLSGRKRDLRAKGNATGRNSRYAREYTCRDCKHTGWSRHIDLRDKEAREASDVDT